MVNSRVEGRNQRKRRYQERACGTEASLNCEYVQQLARVSAYRYYYRSQGAIPKESYVQAADRKVIRDAARPARWRKRWSHCCETRLDVEIGVYTQGGHEK
jgi:hypothetical protein